MHPRGAMRKSPVCDGVCVTVIEYSENTSIPGLKHIGKQNSGWYERLLWGVAAVICLACAVYMVLFLLVKFEDNPIITKIDSYYHETSFIPFPTITLCNVNKILYSKAKELVNSLVIPEREVLSRDDLLQLLPLVGQLILTDSKITEESNAGRMRLMRVLGFNNLTSAQVLEQVGQPCESLIERCSWAGRQVRCSAVFQKRVTHLGYCCVFNSGLERSPHSADAPPPDTVSELRTLKDGHSYGLAVLLNMNPSDFFWAPYASGGVWCGVHGANEVATVRSPSARVANGEEVVLRVVPSVTQASQSLRQVAPGKRRCLFRNEGSLQDSPVYGYERCVSECQRRSIISACSCRPLQLPRPRRQPRQPRRLASAASDVAVCDLEDVPCLHQVEENVDLRLLKLGKRPLPTFVGDEDRSEKLFNRCDCLSQCSTYAYNMWATIGDFHASQYVRGAFYDGANTTGRTLLYVYFGSAITTRFTSDVKSDLVQLISSLGGVFSLFLGCSLLSVAELVYYLTVRLGVLVYRAVSLEESATAAEAHITEFQPQVMQPFRAKEKTETRRFF